MVNELIIGLFLMLVTQIIKKFGLDSPWKIHGFLFVIGLIYGLFSYGWKFLPLPIAESLLGVWGSAVFLYEFLVKTVFAKSE